MTFLSSLSTQSAGSILCCWNTSLFIELSRCCNQRFVGIRENWRFGEGPKWIIFVYTPINVANNRIDYFNSIVSFVQDWEHSDYIIFTNFNSVIQGSERWGINGYDTTSIELNDLVDNLQLQDLTLLATSYSYFGSGKIIAMSRLDRFFICNGSGGWYQCVMSRITFPSPSPLGI